MRLDKLTTKFQEALADAQSLAIGHDHAYIEPAHLLVAMLRQAEGPRALLERAGANAQGLLTAAENAVKRLPQVQGQDQVQGGPELAKVLQATEKEAIDVNFAIHFPLLDRLFGTYYLPKGQWPTGYGIQGHPVPRSYLQQFFYPFLRKRK